MSTQTSSFWNTSTSLIASDRVEGTKVFDATGKSVGTIKRLMLEKVSGRVGYALLSFGGFLGLGDQEIPVPWDQLEYDTSLGGYRTELTEAQLVEAPSTKNRDYDLSDRGRERELHDYYGATYYWQDDDEEL
jgi:hypothetical protein